MKDKTNMEGRDYGYQADLSIDNRMFHVRADTQERFEEIIAYFENNYGVSFKKPLVPETPAVAATVPPAAPGVAAPAQCAICGMALLPEKRIVSTKTGVAKAFWVRDCSSGDQTHKGPIRPAA